MQAASVIQGSLVSQALRNIIEKVGNNTASATDIKASNISLTEKLVLEAVRTGAATRESVMASAIDPPVAALILATPAGLALSSVSGVGAVGLVEGDGTPE